MRRVLFLMVPLSAALACGARSDLGAPPFDDAPIQAGNATGGSVGSGGTGTGGTGTGTAGTGTGTAGTGTDEFACVARYDSYVEYRSTLIEEFESVGCKTADDCVAFHDQSDCDPGCFRIATGARRGLSDRLNLFKLMMCSSFCVSEPLVACPVAPAARCVNSRCL